MTSKPPAAAAAPIKPPCKIHSTATIAEKAQLTGTHQIAIGENSLLHPWAKIRAEHGNVTIGKNCIVSESAIIGAAAPARAEHAEDFGVVIGDGVSVESGAIIEARKIGDHSTIGPKAQIGSGAVVGTWCTIAPMCVVGAEEVLEDYTVVFGGGRRRLDTSVRDRKVVMNARIDSREKEVALLKTLIPDASSKWREA